MSAIDFQDPQPAGQDRRKWLIGGGAAILLLSCCLVALVAGLVLVDPFDLHLIDRLTGRFDATVSAMPPNTSVYVGINVLNLTPQRINRVIRPFLANVDEADFEDYDGALDEFDQELATDLDLTLQDDLLPWLGQYAGFGITDFELDNFQDLERLDWVLALEARDRGAADDFLEKLRDSLLANGDGKYRFSDTEYEGATIFVRETDDLFDRLAFTRSESMVLFGSGLTAVQAAIDARAGDSLADSDTFQQVASRLPSERALSFYVDTTEFESLVEEDSAGLFLSLGLSALPTNGLGAGGFALSLVDAGLRFDAVSVIDPETLTEDQRQLLTSGRQDLEIDSLMPAQTVGFVAGDHLDRFWESFRDGFVSGSSQADFDESMDLFADEFGLNPDQDLFPRLDGEWAVAVLPGQTGLFAEELDVSLGVVLLSETSAPSELAAVLDNLGTSLEDQGLEIEKTEADGVTGYAIRLEADDNPLLTFGQGGSHLFVSTDADTARRVFTGSESLADADHYRDVWREFPGDLVPAVYLDVGRLFGAVREGLSGFDLEDFNDVTRVLDPLTYIASASSVDDKGIRQVTTIFFIKSE